MVVETVVRCDRITHAEWLTARKTGLGGSDAGAIMGVNPYKGAYGVWADKKGLVEAVEENEAMRQGSDFEEYVAKRFTEKTGLKVRRERRILRSVAHPCMIANIDRRVVGRYAGLECKTSRDTRMTRYKGGEIPMEYYCQCVHYMAVTGWDTWYLAVLVYGTDVLIYKLCRSWVESDNVPFVTRIEVADEDIEGLIDAEERYWADYIKGGLTPPLDALDSTVRVLNEAYADEDEEAVDADEETEELLARLVEVRVRKKALDEEITTLENGIKAKMKTAVKLCGREALVTWKAQESRRIDKKLLMAKYPEVDLDEVQKVSRSRVFRVMVAEEGQ